MTSHLLLAAIDYASTPDQIDEYGDPCTYCDAERTVEATVRVRLQVDGEPGTRLADRACCGACVGVVVADVHEGTDSPHVLLAPGTLAPEGVYDPFR